MMYEVAEKKDWLSEKRGFNQTTNKNVERGTTWPNHTWETIISPAI